MICQTWKVHYSAISGHIFRPKKPHYSSPILHLNAQKPGNSKPGFFIRFPDRILMQAKAIALTVILRCNFTPAIQLWSLHVLARMYMIEMVTKRFYMMRWVAINSRRLTFCYLWCTFWLSPYSLNNAKGKDWIRQSSPFFSCYDRALMVVCSSHGSVILCASSSISITNPC